VWEARKVEIAIGTQIKKRADHDCASDSFWAGKAIMRRGISRACTLFAVALLCGHMSLLPAVAQQPQQTREGIIATFAPVVGKVAPSVVTVFTTQTVSRGQAAFSLSDDALRQFFGGSTPQRQGKQTMQGLGSEVIVSRDGYILTANHVVSGADEILIGLGNDLRRFKGKKSRR
jgi:S1-C subfamily serine protease